MTAVPNPPPRPVADWVAANRKPVALALLAVAVACLAVAAICLMKVANESAAAASVAADAPPPAPPSAYRSVYLWGGLIGLFIAGVAGTLGAGYLTRLPSADPARNRHAAGVLILLAGGLVGFLLLVFGAALFRLWFDALVKWVDVRDASEAWKPLTALLVLLAGAGLMFVAAQPARSDERNHGWIRRTVYGINFGLTVVLMVFGLVALNVIVVLKLPAKLDTTQNQSYSLSAGTQQYLADLTQTVQVTVTFTPELVSDPEEQRWATDFRRLLEACQEANPQRFKVTSIHPALNRTELEKLLNKYRQPGAVLEIAGQSEFIPAGDLSDRRTFKGEGELTRRLLFMTEDRDRTVYFSQGRGEPEVVPSQDRKTAGRSARRVAELLAKSNTEVKPLVFDPLAPVVPDDAAALVILAPDQPFSAAEVQAVRTYLTKPRSNGRKGKLVAAIGPTANREGTKLLDIGLDQLLADFGILAEATQLMGEQQQGKGHTEFGLAGVAAAAADHPVAQLLVRGGNTFPNCRVINFAPQPVGPVSALPVGFTYPPQRMTWFETEPPTNPAELYAGVLANKAVQQQKKYSGRGQWPAVVCASEEVPRPSKPGERPDNSIDEVPRVVAFGSGDAFVDAAGDGGPGANATLLATSLNWLRGRPPVAAVAAKPYGVYMPLRAADTTALLWLPVGITLLSVAGLGLGVWSYRRK